MSKSLQIELKLAFNDIIRGYSQVQTAKFGNIIIKHFNSLDMTEIDSVYYENLEKAKKEGLLTAEDQIKKLIKNNLWTEDKEKQIKDKQEEIKSLQLTLSKVYLDREKKTINTRIKEAQQNLISLESERLEVIGYTAETYANKKTNQFFIYIALKNPNHKNLFSANEFEQLEDEELGELVLIYNKITSRFDSQNLKRVALLPLVINLVSLAGEDITNLYGKPVIDLTFYQIELYSLGVHFKELIRENKGELSEEAILDPEKFESEIQNKKTIKEARKHLDKEGSSGVAIMGATKEDLNNLALETGGPITDLTQEAKKRGGSLSMKELMELHGV